MIPYPSALMNATPSVIPTESSTALLETEGPRLQVIIAHEDYLAYARAVRMLANTFFGSPESAGLHPVSWRFDELHSDILRQRATADAPEAEVFVVATSRCDALPECVAEWLSECFALRQGLPTAVIALGETADHQEAPWREPLRAATAAAGLDFLEPCPVVKPPAAG